MARSITAAIIALLLLAAGTASASSAMAVASARVVRATMISTDPLVRQLSVNAADLQHGYISIHGGAVGSGQPDAPAFTVRVEIPSMAASTTFSGDVPLKSARIAVSGTEASLRQSPFAYITYDGQ